MPLKMKQIEGAANAILRPLHGHAHRHPAPAHYLPMGTRPPPTARPSMGMPAGNEEV